MKPVRRQANQLNHHLPRRGTCWKPPSVPVPCTPRCMSPAGVSPCAARGSPSRPGSGATTVRTRSTSSHGPTGSATSRAPSDSCRYPATAMFTRYQPKGRQNRGWETVTPCTRPGGTVWWVVSVSPCRSRSPSVERRTWKPQPAFNRDHATPATENRAGRDAAAPIPVRVSPSSSTASGSSATTRARPASQIRDPASTPSTPPESRTEPRSRPAGTCSMSSPASAASASGRPGSAARSGADASAPAPPSIPDARSRISRRTASASARRRKDSSSADSPPSAASTFTVASPSSRATRGCCRSTAWMRS